MIKKFEEYINEGFWKPGIERAKNNEDRLEVSKFFKRPEIHQIKDYPDYYLEMTGESKNSWHAFNALLIYHYPNEEYVAEYTNYDPDLDNNEQFCEYVEYWEDYYLEGNDEEDNLVQSDEFQKSVWDTVVEEYFSDYERED